MTEEQKNFLKLLERAKEGKHTNFSVLVSMLEWVNLKQYKLALYSIIKILTQTANNLYSTYTKELTFENDNVWLLFSYKEVVDAITYYREELNIIKDIDAEFRCYIRWGHFTKIILLGLDRPEEDRIDWRTTKIQLW